ncbi:MAG: T9SS type A sorting domain-containing protein [Ignavibacteriaceae bacterium]|nr:T9SS type A sorting domain-containing protein [Ignavibacteriaceae bacterium]
MKNTVFTLTVLFFLSLTLTTNTSFAQMHSDPAYIQVVSAADPMTVDGVLDETDWLKRFDYLVYKAGSLPGDVIYTVTDEVLVHGSYPDTTTTFVKFLHNGLDLYISLQSDDHSVGKFGTSWEGDGLFMKIKDASGAAVEYKLYFNVGGVNPDIVYEEPGLYPGSGEGAAWKHSATIVNDTSQVDSGYTAEMVIHLDQLGYTDPYGNIEVMINIFDPDGYEDDMDPYGSVGSYWKSWWGSEWGGEFRTLRLADPQVKNAYVTTNTITLDGILDEGFWTDAESVVVGVGSNTSTGGFYMQWNDTLNSYTDQSMATIKFVHNGTDLYIGVVSDDNSVCKWSPGWEADGLFLWMTNKGDYSPSLRMEIKAMYFTGTVGDGISFETSTSVPTGGAEGASFEPGGTVTHTEVGGPDAGYSLEVVVHTDLFGYVIGDTVRLSCVIWDLDYSSVDAFSADTSDYAPHWWGTQWADPGFEKYNLYRQVVLSNLTDVDENPASVPDAYQLLQNYPNPFNPETNIRYSVPKGTQVTLKVYDVLGNEVATLVNEFKNAGEYNMRWQASNVSSGVYFYELRTDEFVKINKMILLR